MHGRADAVNPARTGTKAAADYALTVPAGESVSVRLRFSPRGPEDFAEASPFADVRRHDDGAPARGRRVLRHRHPARPHRRRPRRDAPEPGRPAVVEAVLPLRREDVARRRPGAAGAAARAPARPQRAVGPPVQRRRHLDAGQVGVPVVRRVGPGVPLRAAGHRRRRVRQGAARADAARVVHAPERPAAGLRVGVRRRQPAGPCVGGVARLQDRREAQRQGRSRLPRARLPEAAPQLHLVGEPQGRRAAPTSSRAASSASTTSASSIDRRRCRPAASSSSPTAPAGWRCTR